MAPRDKEERLNELFEEYGVTEEDQTAFKDALAGKTLRTALEEANKELKELRPIKEKFERLQREPEVFAAAEKAGVDLEALKPLEKKALLAFEDFGDEDKFAAFIEEADLPTTGGGQVEEPEPPSAQVMNHGRQNGRTPSSTALTPETYASWPPSKRHAFNQSNPDAVAALKKGESVPAGSLAG